MERTVGAVEPLLGIDDHAARLSRPFASGRPAVRWWRAVIFDCQSCGACCCNTDENRGEKTADYVLVGARSPLTRHPSLLRELTVLNRQGERHMRLKGAEQRCAALSGELGVRVSCTIYVLRPAGCRRVEPGSKECRRDRRERGIDLVK